MSKSAMTGFTPMRRCGQRFSTSINHIAPRPALGLSPIRMRLSWRAVFSANGDRALIAARTVYPELNPGDDPRVTGTVWLLNPRTDGSWRVISARRTDLE